MVFGGPNAYACHPIHSGVGFHRWVYGQPRKLPMDQRGAHMADMVQTNTSILGHSRPIPWPTYTVNNYSNPKKKKKKKKTKHK